MSGNRLSQPGAMSGGFEHYLMNGDVPLEPVRKIALKLEDPQTVFDLADPRTAGPITEFTQALIQRYARSWWFNTAVFLRRSALDDTAAEDLPPGPARYAGRLGLVSLAGEAEFTASVNGQHYPLLCRTGNYVVAHPQLRFQLSPLPGDTYHALFLGQDITKPPRPLSATSGSN